MLHVWPRSLYMIAVNPRKGMLAPRELHTQYLKLATSEQCAWAHPIASGTRKADTCGSSSNWAAGFRAHGCRILWLDVIEPTETGEGLQHKIANTGANSWQLITLAAAPGWYEERTSDHGNTNPWVSAHAPSHSGSTSQSR